MNNILSPQDIFVRLLAALAVGVTLGIERDLAGKPAGMRTLGLLSLGAAALTLTTLYLQTIQHDANATSRVLQGLIQGVLTGIGFLGAGAVLRDQSQQDVHGLTTAANVLVVAGLGIACGLGAWIIIAMGVALALILLVVLHPVERWLQARREPLPKPPHTAD